MTGMNAQIGWFKANHPQAYSMGDIGGIFFGRTGQLLWGNIYVVRRAVTLHRCLLMLQLTLIMSAGGGMLSLSIALNAVSL